MRFSALRLPFVAAALLALVACQADRFDVDLASGDIARAQAGTPGEARFEMVFSNIGELDDKTRAQMDGFEAVARRYMTIDSFVLDPGDDGPELVIEGRLPVTSDGSTAAPYFLEVSASEAFAGYSAVELVNGRDYLDMREALTKVSYMLTPDRFQPTRIRLAGNGEALIVPGAWVEGEAQALFAGNVADRLSLSFKGGVWDDTGALFLIKLN